MDADSVLQDEVEALMAIFSPSDFILVARVDADTESTKVTHTTSTRPLSAARDADTVVVSLGVDVDDGDCIDSKRHDDNSTATAAADGGSNNDDDDCGGDVGNGGGGEGKASGCVIHSSTTALPPLIRLRLVGGAANTGPSSFDLWLNVQRRQGYPSVPVVVDVVCDPLGCVVSDRLVELAAVGTRLASELARSGEVAVFDVFTAVRDELPGVIGLSASASANSSMYDDEVRSRPGEVETDDNAIGPPSKPPCLRSSDQLGVTLRFLLAFAARHGIGGFCKWETSGESMRHTTESVCLDVIKPATIERRVPFTSLGPPALDAGDCGRPTHFVSHSWGCDLPLTLYIETIDRCPFASLTTALLVHQLGHDTAWAVLEESVDVGRLAARVDSDLKSRGIEENLYWIDVFAKNQHAVESDATAAELADMVRGIPGGVITVIHPLREPRMLSRVWCLYEMHQALVLGRPLTGVPSFDGMLELHAVMEKERKAKEVTTASRRQRADTETRRSGSGGADRTRKETKLARKKSGESKAGDLGFAGALGSTLHACHALCDDAVSRIDVRTAQSSVRRDREMILGQIEKTVGVEEMTRSSRRLARDCISECVAAALDARARQRNSERWSVAAAMLRGPSDGRGVGTDAHSSSHGSTTPPRTSSCPLARGPDTSPAPRRAHSTRATKGRDSLPQSE